MSLLKQFSKDALVFGLGKGIKKFIGLLLLPIYTRALSPEEFGILDTLGAGLFFLTTLFGFGLDSASSYFFFQSQDEKERGKILFTVFSLRLLVIIPAVIISFFCKPISLLIFGTEEYTTAVLITSLLIPVNMLMSEQEHIYRFYRNPWGYNFITITKSLTNIGAGILLVVHYQLSVFGAQTASLISTIIIIVISLLSFTRKKYHFQFSRAWAKKMIKYGFPLVWAGIAVWVYSVSDRFILLHFHDSTQIGYYSIGSTFAQPVGLINMAVQMSFGAIFYEVFHKELTKEKYKSKKLLQDVVKVYIIIASIAVCYLSIFSYEIIGFITTPEYLPGTIVVPIISVAFIFAQLSEIVPVGISISEKTWHFTWIIGVAASVNLILNLIFIPTYGYAGAAATTLAAYLVYFTLADWVSKQYFDTEIPRFKIYFFLTIILGVSLAFPVLETYHNVHMGIGIKMLSAILVLSLPLLLQIISIDQIKTLLKTITTRK